MNGTALTSYVNGELFEPSEYIDQTGPGWFSVLAKPSGVARQNSYTLDLLPTVVKAADPNIDTWITQAVFNAANRRAVNVRSVGLLFADLDTYNVSGLTSKGPEEQALELVAICVAEELPTPSIIMFSGRGLQAKWLLADALSAVGLQEWNEAQLALVKLLRPFAADRASRDISRVLRLDRTTNTKSGQLCRIVFTSSGVDGVLARYQFSDLHRNLTRRFVTDQKQVPSRVNATRLRAVTTSGLSFTRLNWYRLFDLKELWKLRGGVPVGYREVTLFWQLNFLIRAEPGRARDLWCEAQALASQIDPSGGWYTQTDLSTLYRKAKEGRAGDSVQYRGREYPPLYTPRNQTLIDLFVITPKEERYMRTIISKTEKYRRVIEKRRAEGVKPREESLTRTRPWESEGISRRTWYRRRPV